VFIKEEEMKGFRKYGFAMASIVAFFILALSGIVPDVEAQPMNLNTFSAGTTISSSQVNQNFTALANAIPKMKSAGTMSDVILGSQTQNLTSVTVTPPGDGMIVLLASVGITLWEGYNDGSGGNSGGQSWGTVSARLCITPMNNCGNFMLDMPPRASNVGVQNYSPRISFPASFIAMAPATKGVAATYNLTGQKDYADPGGTVIVGGSLVAIFVQMGL
jgi:hypothetical protein